MEWPRKVRKILGDRNVAFGLAFALGLALGPQLAAGAVPLTLPALGVLIAVTAAEVSGRVLRRWRRVARGTALALASTYAVNTVVVASLAGLLMPAADLFAGFALVAASPPAVGGLGFCLALRGDVTLSLIGTVGAHVAALAITPLITLLLVGVGLIEPQQLLLLLVQLIVIPLAASRLLRHWRVLPYVRRWRGLTINWAYAVVIFAVVGVNRDLLFQQPGLVGLVAVVAAASTFGLGALADVVLRRLRVQRAMRVSLILFTTLKNSGFAAAAALALISPRASLPGAVVTVFSSLYLLWLGLEVERHRS
jgi:predicted Na+-dependent transporter